MLRRSARVLLVLPLVAVAMLVPRVDAAREASRFTVNATIEPSTLLFYNLGYLSAHTRIGATCGARVIYSGGGAPADGVGKSAHVGRTGIVSWSFTVDDKATKGTATVTCTWKGQTRRGKAWFRVVAPQPTPTPEPVATATIPPPVAPEGPDMVLAYQLATIDLGHHPDQGDPLIERFARDLTILHPACQIPQRSIGDELVKAWEIVHQHGHTDSLISIADGLVTAMSGRTAKDGVSCADALDFMLPLMLQ